MILHAFKRVFRIYTYRSANPFVDGCSEKIHFGKFPCFEKYNLNLPFKKIVVLSETIILGIAWVEKVLAKYSKVDAVVGELRQILISSTLTTVKEIDREMVMHSHYVRNLNYIACHFKDVLVFSKDCSQISHMLPLL